ncbi:MAG TPA: hypothetical protein VHH53_03070, partial [Pseudonocardiaceae bacterium]|nr:hypothetical protein [Pseudonocardiaceae bacterium]
MTRLPPPQVGRPFPLGAHAEGGGVRFAVASAVAESLEVCLLSPGGAELRVPLAERTFGVWHGLLPGVGPGQRYGYRVHGPWDPARGLRCNPTKLLVDPPRVRVDQQLGRVAPQPACGVPGPMYPIAVALPGSYAG